MLAKQIVKHVLLVKIAQLVVMDFPWILKKSCPLFFIKSLIVAIPVLPHALLAVLQLLIALLARRDIM